MQPGHRRPGQGTAGARGRRPGRGDGPGHRPGRHPVPHPQREQGARRPRPARPGRPQAVQTGRVVLSSPAAGADHPRRRRRGPGLRCRRGPRRGAHGRGRRHRRRGRGGDHRHLPPGRDPRRRGADSGGAGGGQARRRAGLHVQAPGVRPWTPEDGHAAAPGRPYHLLRRAGGAAGRRSPGAVLLPHPAHRDAPDELPHHRHDARDPRPHPRQPAPGAHVFGTDRGHRPALLPVHRGQGGALRRPPAAPDFPGAGRARRPHGLPQRHLDVPAQGGAAGASEDHSGPGTGGHAAPRVRHRV